MSGIVGPQRCTHCSRAIFYRCDRWVHVNGSQHCYSPSGDKLEASPRVTDATQDRAGAIARHPSSQLDIDRHDS